MIASDCFWRYYNNQAMHVIFRTFHTCNMQDCECMQYAVLPMHAICSTSNALRIDYSSTGTHLWIARSSGIPLAKVIAPPLPLLCKTPLGYGGGTTNNPETWANNVGTKLQIPSRGATVETRNCRC